MVDGVEAVRETIEIAERSGARVVGHHVKVKGPNFWGASRAYVELMQRARSRGVQVYFSIYGYDSYRNLSTTMGHSTGLIREQCPVW